MRIDFRRSFLLAVAFPLTAMLVITADRSTPPAGALGQGSRATYGRSVDRPSLTVRRREARFRASRSALRSRLAPAPATSRPARARVQAAAAVPGDDLWAKLRKCEAGGRYDANSGNGYYGAYQFSVGTWHKLGYSGLPHQAPPEVQDEAARKLQARSGWGQWPACSRRIGAR
jgi:resuscitation-promoting factor RpfA